MEMAFGQLCISGSTHSAFASTWFPFKHSAVKSVRATSPRRARCITRRPLKAESTDLGNGWKEVSPREKRIVLVPQSWHNKTGELVRQVDDDVWVIERGYIFLKSIDVGGRTTIVRLTDGTLFVHAPLALTKAAKKCIDEIGRVKVVVAPNTEHVDFIAQWKTHYPDACYLGPPGCLEKLSHIPFTRELSRDDVLDEELSGAPLSQFFISTAPFFNETLFVHHSSKSLLCTDFYWAYPSSPDVPVATLMWGWAMNNIYKPVYNRVLIKDQREFVRCLNAVLSSNFDKIIPCHGDIIESEGKETLERFFASKLGA